jgi:hypothetical protein
VSSTPAEDAAMRRALALAASYHRLTPTEATRIGPDPRTIAVSTEEP